MRLITIDKCQECGLVWYVYHDDETQFMYYDIRIDVNAREAVEVCKYHDATKMECLHGYWICG